MGTLAKYTANKLDCFEFHDAVVVDVAINENDMVWTLEAVNVTTDSPHNNHDCDMSAGTLVLTFKNHEIVEFISYGCESWFEGKLIEKIPDKEIQKSEYASALESFEYINGYGKSEDIALVHEFDVIAGGDFFLIGIKCTGVIAEWNEYTGKAWYEDRRK